MFPTGWMPFAGTVCGIMAFFPKQQLTSSCVVRSAFPSSHSIPWFSPAGSAPDDLSRCWTLPQPVNRWVWPPSPILTAHRSTNHKTDWLTDFNYLRINFLDFLFGLLFNEGHHVLDLPRETHTKTGSSNSDVSQRVQPSCIIIHNS